MDQTKDSRRPDDIASSKAPRKPYVPPRLIRHGSVAELSQGIHSVLNDAKVGRVLRR